MKRTSSLFKHDLRHTSNRVDYVVVAPIRSQSLSPETNCPGLLGRHECINEIMPNLVGEIKVVTVDEITRELEKVVDPEIGLPITEMHLVDEIDIKEDGVLFIKYHLTAPFCPPIFAEDIGMNIRQLTSKLDGVKKVTVILHGHALANEINQRVNPDYTPPKSP